jgi:hypothetical protein
MDFMELFMEIFKLDYSIVNEYASQGVLYQLFYLVFFPTLFIIFFIYITSRYVIHSHKGLRIVIAVAIYAFIVLQGLYKWFVFLSKFWLFGIIFLGVIYMIFNRGKEAPPAGSGKGKLLDGLNLSFGKVFGQVDPFGHVKNEVDMIKTNIDFIYRSLVEGNKGRHIEEIINRVHRDIDEISKQIPMGRKNPLIKKMKDNLERAMKGEPPKW